MPVSHAIFVVYLSHPKLPSHSSEEWVTVCAKTASCKGIRILESGKFLFLLFGILGFFESGVQIKESRMPLCVISRFPCTFEPCFFSEADLTRVCKKNYLSKPNHSMPSLRVKWLVSQPELSKYNDIYLYCPGKLPVVTKRKWWKRVGTSSVARGIC